MWRVERGRGEGEWGKKKYDPDTFFFSSSSLLLPCSSSRSLLSRNALSFPMRIPPRSELARLDEGEKEGGEPALTALLHRRRRPSDFFFFAFQQSSYFGSNFKTKASFGAHPRRRLCASWLLQLSLSSSSRVKGHAGAPSRGKTEQLRGGRERESACPGKKQFRFSRLRAKGKRNQILANGRNAPLPLSLSLSPLTLSIRSLTWAHTRHRKLSNCWTEAFQLGPSQSADAPESGCAEPPPTERDEDERFAGEESSSSPEEQ